METSLDLVVDSGDLPPEYVAMSFFAGLTHLFITMSAWIDVGLF